MGSKLNRTRRAQKETRDRALIFARSRQHLNAWNRLGFNTKRNSIPLLRMHQTLIFGQDVPKSKDARRVSEPWKIRLHRAWPSSILHWNFSGLQINDILFLLSFDLGEIRIFWRYFYCRWPGDRKMGSALMPIEGLSLLLASIQAQIIVKGIQKWNSHNKDCTKETIETLMWLRRSCGGELREAECFATTR